MIKLLDNETIEKIAAGEVVERPQSIVKELVENSIDANSKNIIVEIKNGGKSFIKINDDGDGIPKDDIELAFKRHATSKIKDFNDLYKIYSMGFRGEALSSIISVAKLNMKTKTKDDTVGTNIIYDNGKMISKKSIGMNKGTIIEVSDLFKYIPVREKFLSTDITEANKITNLMYSFAIGNPNISFTYIKDNREVFKTIISDDKKINQSILFGKDFVKNSIDIDIESTNYKVYGTISNNKYYKGNRSMQFIYVNDRYIKNDNIVQYIENAYSNYIPTGRFPLFELHIEVDPKNIDINIHPNKQKIKFSFDDEIYTLLNNNIKRILHENDSLNVIENKDNKRDEIRFYELNEGDGYKKILDLYKKPNTSLRDNKEDSISNDSLIKKDTSYINFNDISSDKDYSSDNNTDNIYENEDLYNKVNYTNDYSSYKEDEDNIEDNKILDTQISFIDNDFIYKDIILNKYIMLENSKLEKIIFIDINRANERIIYDSEVVNRKITSRQIIDPIIIELTKKDLELFKNNKNIIQDLGYDVDLFDEDSIAIRSIPHFSDNIINKKSFLLLLDDLNKLSINKDKDINKNLLKSVLQLSINSKVNLSEDEVNMLIKELYQSSNPNTSPHGKSIIYEISFKTFREFLDK